MRLAQALPLFLALACPDVKAFAPWRVRRAAFSSLNDVPEHHFLDAKIVVDEQQVVEERTSASSNDEALRELSVDSMGAAGEVFSFAKKKARNNVNGKNVNGANGYNMNGANGYNVNGANGYNVNGAATKLGPIVNGANVNGGGVTKLGPLPPRDEPSSSVPPRVAYFDTVAPRYSNGQAEPRNYNGRQQPQPGYNNGQQQAAPEYSNGQQEPPPGYYKAQPEYYNGQQQAAPEYSSGQQQPQQGYSNGQQQPQPGCYNGQQQPQPGYYNGQQQPRQEYYNGQQQAQPEYYNGKQQPEPAYNYNGQQATFAEEPEYYNGQQVEREYYNGQQAEPEYYNGQRVSFAEEPEYYNGRQAEAEYFDGRQASFVEEPEYYDGLQAEPEYYNGQQDSFVEEPEYYDGQASFTEAPGTVSALDVVSAREEVVRPSLEERIAESVAEAKAIAKSIGATEASFVSTRENLRDFKSRTQRRLRRASIEKERALEKIASFKSKIQKVEQRLQDKLEENQFIKGSERRLSRASAQVEKAAEKIADFKSKMQEVEQSFQAKLVETQLLIDSEVDRLEQLLTSEMQQEVEIEEQIVGIMNTLQEAVASKEYDVALEEKITHEMMVVRSRLKPGAVAQKLDELVEQKTQKLAIETELVKGLFDCLVELQVILDDARARGSIAEAALDSLVRPEVGVSSTYEWSDLEKMEVVLEQAAEKVATSAKRIREIRRQIDDALVERLLFLGEEVPPRLAAAATRVASRNIKETVTSLPSSIKETVASSIPSVKLENVEDFSEKDEKELVTMLTSSAGAATAEGSKAALYGLKAVLDTVTGEPLVEAAKTIGKAGSTIASSIGQSDAAKVAGDALNKTSNGVFKSANAAAALSAKLYDKYKQRIKDIKTERKEEEEARKRKRLAEKSKRNRGTANGAQLSRSTGTTDGIGEPHDDNVSNVEGVLLPQPPKERPPRPKDALEPRPPKERPPRPKDL